MRLTFLLLFFQFTISQFTNAQDWPNLSRYRDSNVKLMQLPDPGDRVVFMGNSITDSWINASPDFFEKNHYVDRGISGQTSPQMLLRFRADVIDLHPKAVVLLCCTNDIAGNTGPSTLEMTEDNITSMAELAKVNKIKIILCSVLPAIRYSWKPEVKPADQIIALNIWIKGYADKNNMIYLDYYSSMVNEEKGMKAEYSEDGVHPNKAGYLVMEKLADPVIKKTIRVKQSLFK
jgi:lysophospholipase L1-like esterase